MRVTLIKQPSQWLTAARGTEGGGLVCSIDSPSAGGRAPQGIELSRRHYKEFGVRVRRSFWVAAMVVAFTF